VIHGEVVHVVAEQVVRADNTRVSLTLAACKKLKCVLLTEKYFGYHDRAGEEEQAASLRSPAAVAAQLQRWA
jgi:hypothetical protein